MKYPLLTLLIGSSLLFVSCGSAAEDSVIDQTRGSGVVMTGDNMPAQETYQDASKGESFSSETDMIRVASPAPGALVGKEILLSGSARAWYFEGSFPVRVEDDNGEVLYQGSVEATGDWMSTDFVPFDTTVSLTKEPTTPRGVIVLEKSNPSGLPEFDASFELPVQFQ